MTSSERASLRSYAMAMQPTTNIGKNGVNDMLIKQVEEQLECRELVKISVLKNSGGSAEEYAQEVAQKTNSEVVQVIGNKITVYRKSKRNGIKHLI